MCWLRRTLLLLLIVPNFGLVFEKFFIDTVYQRTSATQNRLSNCLISILSDGSLPFKPVIHFHIEAQSASVRQEFIDTIDNFCAKSDEVAIKLSNIRTLDIQKHNCWLLFIDSIKSLQHLRNIVIAQETRNVVLSPKEEYYFIIIPKDTPNLRQFMKQIFKFCWSKPIINVNVLIEEASEGIVTIYTYYPFTRTFCRNVLPTVQNRFINGTFEKNESIFLSKTSNFWKCPINVILWEEELFPGENQKSLHGADYLYLETLAQMLNSSLRFVESPRGTRGVYGNRSYDKAFKLLNDKVGDLMLGLWCTRERLLVFEGVPYNFDNELIIFKIPEAYSSLDILRFLCDGYTWIILMLLLIGKWILKLFLKQFSKVRIRRRKNAEKLFLGSWLLSIFILRIFYEGIIFKFLHNKPRLLLPNSLDEALIQDYKFIVPISGLTAYSQMQGLNESLISGNESEYFEIFNKLGDKYALIASEKYVAAYKIKIENYFTAKKPLMKPMDCFYLPRYSFLTNKFEILLKVLDEHGIRNKINANFTSKKNVFLKDAGPKKFSLKHVLGAFDMLAVLSILSVLIFCMELLSRKNKYLSKIMELLH